MSSHLQTEESRVLKQMRLSKLLSSEESVFDVKTPSTLPDASYA